MISHLSHTFSYSVSPVQTHCGVSGGGRGCIDIIFVSSPLVNCIPCRPLNKKLYISVYGNYKVREHSNMISHSHTDFQNFHF